jgi:serine beta-lactamase-like protein LACTB, mitochondrial
MSTLIEAQFGPSRCPGLSLAVAADNKIVFSQAYGMADLEQGVRLSTRSVHRLASLSKLVTATIIMEFVQDGKLLLDDPVRKYVPELPASYRDVTIRHLLTHQAGVRAYRDLEEVFSIVHYATSRDALRAFGNDPLLFPPGTETEYSTYGFTILGAVAEALAERSFQDLSADFFFRHNIKGFSLDDPFSMVPARVRGYRVDEKEKVWNARAYDPSNKYPAGGFVASAEDFLTFVLLVDSGKTIRAETVRRMWSPQALSDGTETPFGLGWGVGTLRGNRMVGFNGLQPGSQTLMRFFPEKGVGVVLACNAEGARDLDGLLAKILDVVLPTNE